MERENDILIGVVLGSLATIGLISGCVYAVKSGLVDKVKTMCKDLTECKE